MQSGRNKVRDIRQEEGRKLRKLQEKQMIEEKLREIKDLRAAFAKW